MNVLPILTGSPYPWLATRSRGRWFVRLAAATFVLSLAVSSIAATNVVRMVGTTFQPKFLTNDPGDTILWTNTSTFVQHNVVSSNNAWTASSLFTSPGTFKVTLTTPGIYGYFCNPHRLAGMTGIIYVRAANQPPVVSITNPPSSLTLAAPATVTLGASANDPDGTVAEVEFFSGTTSLGTDASAPYSVSVPNLPAGNYTFIAQARDDAGLSSTSGTVSLTVVTPAPPQFQPSVSTAQGEFSLRLSVIPGLRYEISSATDLSNWANYTNFTASQPVMLFSVPTASPERKFFRARLLPNP